MQQSLGLDSHPVPLLLERLLAQRLRDRDVRMVEFAVAEDANVRNGRDLLTDQFENGTAKIAGNSTVGLCIPQPIRQESMVESLTTERKPFNPCGSDNGSVRHGAYTL